MRVYLLSLYTYMLKQTKLSLYTKINLIRMIITIKTNQLNKIRGFHCFLNSVSVPEGSYIAWDIKK